MRAVDLNKRKVQNTVTNGLFLVLSDRLFQITKGTDFLNATGWRSIAPAEHYWAVGRIHSFVERKHWWPAAWFAFSLKRKLVKLVACCRLGFVNASESLLQ
jgi:hypothetical protein